MAVVDKALPNNLDAERSLLGSMIVSKDALIDIVGIVNEDDYYSDAHRHIHMAVMGLFNRNAPIDILTLSEELRKAGVLSDVGGSKYLEELAQKGVLYFHAKEYAKIVEEKSVRRKLIIASKAIEENGYKFDDSRALIEFAEKSIFDISERQNKEGLTGIKEIILETHEEIENLSRNPDALTGVSTGLVDLDFKTNGLHKSDLVIIAARPSMGKSAFGINLCQNAALRSGAAVAIFSLEMSKTQIVQRMLASESMVPLGNIRSGDLSDTEWTNLASAMSPLANTEIFIDDTPGLTVMEIRAKSRRLKMERGKLDIVLIDYLQLMSGGAGSTESRQMEISNISRGLKGLARELDCTVIALAQLSRAPEQRADHRPMLSDLRESGAIEQDADIVMFLYRDEYYHEDSEDKNIAELIVGKQRNGETGTVKLAWLGKYVKFGNIQKQGY